MSFKFPSLQSFGQSLQQTSQQLGQQIQEGIQNVSKEATSLNQNLSPIFKRTQRSLQEKLGQIDDISALPEEYIDLEKKADALRIVYKKILAITSQYEIESYDYPPNLKESVFDVTKTIGEKIQGLSHATTTAEAEAVLIAPAGNQYPKTFSHSLSKVVTASNDNLLKSQNDQESSLTQALLKIADTEYRIGDKRLEQDKLIINEFNNKIRYVLENSFTETTKHRRNVETSRLTFDTIRAEIKKAQAGDDTAEVPAEMEKKLELAEDELVHSTEVAVESLKKLLQPTDSINLLKVFTKIRLNYYKSVSESLSELVDQLDALPEDEDDAEDSRFTE
ncbi:BA75_03129T0 [Komagataella pastoris]|uniref:BA75_03129T0 n=1 Tax=Komagataella pastoris TaxID=4922 RepID=A0A1B2JDT6_PICPA|nr:BA75_03129T0 [Komagataella pastoris]